VEQVDIFLGKQISLNSAHADINRALTSAVFSGREYVYISEKYGKTVGDSPKLKKQPKIRKEPP
jgi:hypothetical protein